MNINYLIALFAKLSNIQPIAGNYQVALIFGFSQKLYPRFFLISTHESIYRIDHDFIIITLPMERINTGWAVSIKTHKSSLCLSLINVSYLSWLFLLIRHGPGLNKPVL